MEVALFVPDLRGGGVERVRLLLAREFLVKGHDVDLVLLRKQGVLMDQVPPQVRIILPSNRDLCSYYEAR